MKWLVLCLSILASGAAEAHANGASYLQIVADDGGNRIGASWDIAAADLQLPLELDVDGDGVLTGSELQSRRPAIILFATERLGIRRGGDTCRLSVGKLATLRRQSEDFLRLEIDGTCSRTGPLEVSTNLFFGSSGYSAMLDVRTPSGRFPAVLFMSGSSWNEPAVAALSGTLLRFLREGFRHVLIGYDHIAFLLLLLLPSVLRRSKSGWSAATSGRDVVLDLLKVVTAFTIAHSVTLGLVTTGAVRVPVQPIEVAIAGSIVIAGVLNLFPAACRWRLRLAFGFGFIHGFGFANALHEIGADGTRLAPMLAGFNLGVEFGQLSIVALTLPVLWLLSRTSRYATRIMPALSMATALTGAVWFAGRL
ncbi:MAG: HupE/UreJ family protein [Steroidobacteraceae bacterium]